MGIYRKILRHIVIILAGQEVRGRWGRDALSCQQILVMEHPQNEIPRVDDIDTVKEVGYCTLVPSPYYLVLEGGKKD